MALQEYVKGFQEKLENISKHFYGTGNNGGTVGYYEMHFKFCNHFSVICIFFFFSSSFACVFKQNSLDTLKVKTVRRLSISYQAIRF